MNELIQEKMGRIPIEPSAPLTSQLRTELWGRVAERLQQGEVLISNQHFEGVATEEYTRLTGQVPSDRVLQQIRHMIAAVNREHPETYLASGLQNGIRQAFEKGVHKLKWDVAKIQARGAGSLRRNGIHRRPADTQRG